MRFHSQGKQATDYCFSAASRSSSDRTWNDFHGITFASNREGTPSQRASHPIHGLPPQGKRPQECLWTGPQTQQHDEARDEIREGFGNVVSIERPTHLLETEFACATRSPSSNDDGDSSESAHSRGCPASNDETFRSPLGFHIPEAKLRNAMLAEPASTASYWHFSLYQGPGGEKDKVKVRF